MGYLDNPTNMQAEIRDLLRRVRQLETGSPLGNTSITRGVLRVASPEGLVVEGSEKVSGTLEVTGTLVLSGTLNGDGTITWTGPLNLQGVTVITGDTTVQGPFHVDGATDINGTLAVKGATTLSNDLNVTTGGGITIDSANPLKLSPDGNHAVEWASGAYLQSNDGGVGIGASGFSSAFVAAADGSAALYYPNGQIAVWSSAVNGLSFYSPDGTKVMRLTNAGLVGP